VVEGHAVRLVRPAELVKTFWRNMARILDRMDRAGLTEDHQNELFVLALRKVLELFGDPVKPQGKVLPWPKTDEPKPGPF
jgi:hypothetical protein